MLVPSVPLFFWPWTDWCPRTSPHNSPSNSLRYAKTEWRECQWYTLMTLVSKTNVRWLMNPLVPTKAGESVDGGMQSSLGSKLSPAIVWMIIMHTWACSFSRKLASSFWFYCSLVSICRVQNVISNLSCFVEFFRHRYLFALSSSEYNLWIT